MKNQFNGNLRLAALTAVIGTGLSTIAHAGTPAPMVEEIAVVEDDSVVSGSLSFDLNSHFISYGFDVWGGGDSFGGNSTFNPSLELNWGITDNLTLILGTWWDVNNNVTSSIGGDLQEVDVWAGGSYAMGDWSFTAIYQAWIYAGDTEKVFDFSVGYSITDSLSASLLLHNRNSPGASGGENGNILIPGIEYAFDLGPVSFAVPVAVGFFLEDNYHPTTALVPQTDSGFGYLSVGLSASYALPIDDKFGEWDIHGGITYFATEDDVIPTNPSDSFFTWNVGIGCSF